MPFSFLYTSFTNVSKSKVKKLYYFSDGLRMGRFLDNFIKYRKNEIRFSIQLNITSKKHKRYAMILTLYQKSTYIGFRIIYWQLAFFPSKKLAAGTCFRLVVDGLYKSVVNFLLHFSFQGPALCLRRMDKNKLGDLKIGAAELLHYYG